MASQLKHEASVLWDCATIVAINSADEWMVGVKLTRSERIYLISLLLS